MLQVLFAPVSDRFTMPEQAYMYDAGFDVFAAENRLMAYGEIILIHLGFKMSLPWGYEAQIRPRSSMAKKGIIVPNSPGTIDAGYRDEVCVLLQNLNPQHDIFKINAGDKIAQMVIQKIPPVEVCQVSVMDLPPSERGERGVGSSGQYALHS